MYKTIVVVDDSSSDLSSVAAEVITFERYLADYPKKGEPKTRIINLCDTEHYLSRGYYCSLLAEARRHKVLPSVSTINDLRAFGSESIAFTSLGKLSLDASTPEECLVFFGDANVPELTTLGRRIFDRYPAPILRVRFENRNGAHSIAVERLALSQLDADQCRAFLGALEKFTQDVWRAPVSRGRLRWDLAILVNPDEPTPPSDREALQRFVKAAAKVGINAQTITANESAQILQFDGLFIRETTAIDHHTYRMARRAEREGLVVIDDPTSILRCCNKVYLHDAFTYQGVPSLKTEVVIACSEDELDRLESVFTYPMVIKLPESSFSKGVFKVRDRQELQTRISELLKQTALLLVQEYLFTEFDWRIGVLGGRAIYACRYHMARNHWQIYNHGAKRFSSGGYDTLPTFEAPKAVLDAALKAAKMIGNGLYGVDIKQKDKQVYVIEVNDNPSIDCGVEDEYLGAELYMQIMSEFAMRLEKRGRKS